MGINESYSMAVSYVRDNHVFYKGRFPGPGLADDIHMSAPVLFFDAKKYPDIPVVGNGQGSEEVISMLAHCSNCVRYTYRKKSAITVFWGN